MKIGLVAGESSGDLLGAGLIRAIRARCPGAVFEGVAGPAMLDAGCEQWASAESLAVMGLVEPLRHIPRLLRLRRALRRRWQASPPDVFVGIDAPDFNLGLERGLRLSGVPTVHYVSPSIWAWRPGRIRTVQRAADRVLCILPFEKALYDEQGIDAVFVGHPRADSIPVEVDIDAAKAELGFGTEPVIAILPGSRRGEVRRLGPVLYGAAAALLGKVPELRFVTPVASSSLRGMIVEQVASSGLANAVRILDGKSEAAMSAADIVVLASGTAALESALLGKPTVAAYTLAPFSYVILRALRLVKLQYFTLPNLLTEEPLVPEFIQRRATPAAIADSVYALLGDADRRQAIADRFAKLRAELARDTDRQAAAAVIELAK